MSKANTCASVGLLALFLGGCELGNSLTNVADQLANPELETLGSGRQVVEGSHRNIRFDGTAADGAFVVALRDDSALVIVPFNDGPGCDVGPARSSRPALLRTEDDSVKLDARIPFQALLEDGTRVLRFTDFRCDVEALELEGGSLPLSTSFAREPGFIAQDDKGSIYFLDPWANEKKLLVEDTISLRSSKNAIFAAGPDGKDRMWSISDGELVLHNRALEVEQRGGSDLVSFAHSASGKNGPVVAVRNSKGELFTANASDISKLKQVDKETCGVGFNSGANGLELIYFSPCGDRELVVQELDTDVRRSLGEGIIDYKIVGATETGPVMLYMTDPDPSAPDRGTLRARWGENPPLTLGKKAHLGLSRLKVTEEAQVVVDWDETGGTLKRGKPGEDLEVIAKRVSYVSSLGIISDFDGLTGRLSELDSKTGELTLLAKKVTPQGIRRDKATERALVLTDFDGQAGDLTLLEGGEAQVLSANVRPGPAYQFTSLLPMVTILSDQDPETGTATLKLRYLDRDEQVLVSEGVSESLEVAWPREGILYSVTQGEDAGIWFAEAQ